jgi:sirohydrochlorin cobaltochelatase
MMSSSPQEDTQMKTVVVLAMHGSPPRDFPKAQVALVVGLHMWLERASGLVRAMIELYHTRLDTRIRTWPRTAENDPFHAASQELAAQLSQEAGYKVIVGYNEFCAPSLDEALDQAAAQGAERVIVVTPMMTPGGEHAEEDIPAAIRRAEERHPGITFVYAWPFKVEDVAQFLAIQVEQLS